MIKYLEYFQVIELHANLITQFGGMSGLRDEGSLRSCLEMPKSGFSGKEMFPNLSDKAAAYLYYIVGNHPFCDGNKRTGSMAALLFLRLNGIPANCLPPADAYEDFVVKVASDHLSKEEIAFYFQSRLN